MAEVAEEPVDAGPATGSSQLRRIASRAANTNGAVAPAPAGGASSSIPFADAIDAARKRHAARTRQTNLVRIRSYFFAGALSLTLAAVIPSVFIFTTTRDPTASSLCFATWPSASCQVVLTSSGVSFGRCPYLF